MFGSSQTSVWRVAVSATNTYIECHTSNRTNPMASQTEISDESNFFFLTILLNLIKSNILYVSWQVFIAYARCAKGLHLLQIPSTFLAAAAQLFIFNNNNDHFSMANPDQS